MIKFFVYDSNTREYVTTRLAVDADAAIAFARRYYRGGNPAREFRVSVRRLGAPWLSALATIKLKNERFRAANPDLPEASYGPEPRGVFAPR